MTVAHSKPARARWDFWAIATAAPMVTIVLICSALPLAWMVVVLLGNPQVRSELVLTHFRAGLLARTLGYNACVALIATAMGLPAAFVLGRGRGLFARLLWVILPATLLLPSLSYAYGWSQLLRMQRPSLETAVGRAVTLADGQEVRRLHLPVIGDVDLNVRQWFAPAGPVDVFRCIWSLASWLWAVPAALVGLALRRMDTAVQQHAVLDGALLRVTLRQLAGPIIASLAIVTVLATQEFSVYEPTGISVVATELRMVFDTGMLSSVTNHITASGLGGAGLQSPDQAARAAACIAAAAPLLAVTVLLAIIAAWGASRVSASDAVALGDWPASLDTSTRIMLLSAALVALNVLVPVWALLHSLKIHRSVIDIIEEFRPKALGALLVAAEAAAVAAIVALSASGRAVRGMLLLAVASFLIGGQLLAIALIRIYNRPGLAWACNSSAVPVIAYIGRFGWLALAAGGATWSRPWRDLRDIACVDGAGPLRTTATIIWPLAWPTLLAGGLLVGALSLSEVPATVLLLPHNPDVLTPMLMTWLHMVQFDSMIEASLLMMGMVIVPALAAVLLLELGAKTMRLKR